MCRSKNPQLGGFFRCSAGWMVIVGSVLWWPTPDRSKRRERIRFLCRPSLSIVDEIGYLPVIPGGGNLFFQLVNAHYVLVSGIADAIVPDGQGGIDAVIDWKSDVNPTPAAINHYRKQIDEYRQTIGAKRALLVFMTLGRAIEVT